MHLQVSCLQVSGSTSSMSLDSEVSAIANLRAGDNPGDRALRREVRDAAREYAPGGAGAIAASKHFSQMMDEADNGYAHRRTLYNPVDDSSDGSSECVSFRHQTEPDVYGNTYEYCIYRQTIDAFVDDSVN